MPLLTSGADGRYLRPLVRRRRAGRGAPVPEHVGGYRRVSAGIGACLTWLAGFGGPARVGLEATGTYHLPLATALHQAGHTVLVCDPLGLARSGEAVLVRTKTDAADARLIARFRTGHDLVPWAPPSPDQQRLHALVTARETLGQERPRRRNRQHAAGSTPQAGLVTEPQAPVLEAIQAQIERIDQERARLAAAPTPLGQQRRRLTSSPGRGVVPAVTLLASRPLSRLTPPRQVAASVGLCPREHTSGSSVRRRRRIGPLGPAHLRKAL